MIESREKTYQKGGFLGLNVDPWHFGFHQATALILNKGRE